MDMLEYPNSIHDISGHMPQSSRLQHLSIFQTHGPLSPLSAFPPADMTTTFSPTQKVSPRLDILMGLAESTKSIHQYWRFFAFEFLTRGIEASIRRESSSSQECLVAVLDLEQGVVAGVGVVALVAHRYK